MDFFGPLKTSYVKICLNFDFTKRGQRSNIFATNACFLKVVKKYFSFLVIEMFADFWKPRFCHFLENRAIWKIARNTVELRPMDPRVHRE